MAGLAAADLDRDIVLQVAPYLTSESGEKTPDWDNAEEQIVAAQWIPGATREGYESQHRLESHAEGLFRIYDMNPRPTPDNTRILFEDRVYDIRPYANMDRGNWLEISVVARGE